MSFSSGMVPMQQTHSGLLLSQWQLAFRMRLQTGFKILLGLNEILYSGNICGLRCSIYGLFGSPLLISRQQSKAELVIFCLLFLAPPFALFPHVGHWMFGVLCWGLALGYITISLRKIRWSQRMIRADRERGLSARIVRPDGPCRRWARTVRSRTMCVGSPCEPSAQSVRLDTCWRHGRAFSN